MHLLQCVHVERPDPMESVPHATTLDDLEPFVQAPRAERDDDGRSDDGPPTEDCDLDSPGYGFGV
jgi:hypothetical protein